MASTGQGHVFTTPESIAELIRLRMSGKSYKQIGEIFGVDHSTIVYHCKRQGITLAHDKTIQLFRLVLQGFSRDEIAERLGIPGTVVEFYCVRYETWGARMLTRADLPKWPLTTKPSKDSKRSVTDLNPKQAILIKMDENGVEWRTDEYGEWICLGKTEKQKKLDVSNRKKKALETKRLDMLTY